MEYYYGQEADMFTFYRLPKLLFTDPRYKSLPTDAKVLYGFMLDRMGLSLKNHRQDALGRTYIFFRQDEAAELLGIGKNKATKLYRELEKAGLIERKRQGLTHPNIIYVGRLTAIPTPSTAARPAKEQFSTSPEPLAASESHFSGFSNTEKKDSGNGKNVILETPQTGFYLNNTESNDTYNEQNQSIYRATDVENPSPFDEHEDLTDFYKKKFKFYVHYDSFLKHEYPQWHMMSTIDEIIDIIADECSSTKPTIRAAGEERPRSEFRRRLMNFDDLSLSRILYKLEHLDPSTQIRNRRAYLITMLYNHESTDPTPDEETYL